MERITIQMEYHYKGKSNDVVVLIQNYGEDVDILTSYGEVVTTVQTGYGLSRALQELQDGEFD